MRYSLGVLLLLGLFTACGEAQFKAESLPEAVGSPGELVVVCDDAIWKGRSGLELKKTYAAEQPGMPQAEPWFKIIRFDEGKFNSISRKYRSILLVTTLDNDSKTSRYIRNLLGEKQYTEQLTDSTFLFIESADRWARGQQVLYLIGLDDKSLARAVERKRPELLAFMNKTERNRMASSIQKKARNKRLEKSIADTLGITLAIPQSYKLRTLEPGFVWFSREDVDKSLNFFISTRPYTDAADFSSERILAFKDSISKARIPGPLEGSWYTTEYLVPPDTFVSSFNSEYALQMRGLWRVENDFMGGPFIHLTGYDAQRNRLISFEGFVYYPKEKKRELLRELEAIMATAKLSTR